MLKRLLLHFLNTRMSVVMWCTSLAVVLVFYWTSGYRDRLNNGQDVVLLWWTEGFPGTSQEIHCKSGVRCKVLSEGDSSGVSAYLFYGSNIDFDHLPLPRRGDTIWALYHEESPRNVAELSHEPVLQLFNYSSTFSRHSDVPCTLQYLGSLSDITSTEFFVQTADKNKHLGELAPILYIQSDCDTSTERDAYVRELMKYIKVDSYGACLNNKHLPATFKEDYLNNLDKREFLMFIARYKFVIAIENGVCNDYVTEKLWRALKVGSVPIYFGAPNVRDWLPNDAAAILLQEYNTVAELVARLNMLLDDDTLYEGHLRHKTAARIDNERLLREFRNNPRSADALETAARLECLVCESIHGSMAGARAPRTLDSKHYECPKPMSALTLAANPANEWVHLWETAKRKAQQIHRKVTQTIQ